MTCMLLMHPTFIYIYTVRTLCGQINVSFIYLYVWKRYIKSSSLYFQRFM